MDRKKGPQAKGNEPQNNLKDISGNKGLGPRLSELYRGQELNDAGKYEEAYEICYNWLRLNPEDPAALCLLVSILCNTDKIAVAYPIARRLTQIAPDAAVSWLNFGRCAGDLWRYKEAERAYKRGLELAVDDATKSSICVNISCMLVDHGKFGRAEKWARKAITFNDSTQKGKANLGFCQLAHRDWAEGWKNYRYAIGENGRYFAQYNNEQLWNGEKGTILVYGEQGLGDEISFSQMLPDMQKWCDENDSRLIVDVNYRLLDMLRRSFPDIEIYGSRGQKYCDFDASVVEYSLPMAQLGEFFRNSDDSFVDGQYLVPDPDRVDMWRHHFSKIKKPIIGIGWQGGTWKTATKFRQLTLEQLLPVMKSVDAHWVSLQYKPAGAQIAAFKKEHPEIDLVEYKHGTLSSDYDDTVAMMAAMDMVVSMQTTVIHVAGALGLPAWVLISTSSQWRYDEEGEDYPWAKSVRLIRQKTDGYWDDVMETTGEELANFPLLSTAAAEIARGPEDKLRHNGGKVRANHKRNGKHAGRKGDSRLRVRSQSQSDGDIQAGP
jgi:hypothetical protein